MHSRFMIHLEKDENDKLTCKFGGQFYFSVRIFGWGLTAALSVMAGSLLFKGLVALNLRVCGLKLCMFCIEDVAPFVARGLIHESRIAKKGEPNGLWY